MQKVIYSTLLIVLMTGCSLLKRSVETGDGRKSLTVNYGDVIKQNITNKGFFITRAEVVAELDNGSYRFVATIKFSPPGEYLVSLRMKTGLEVMRAYIDSDTIMANDRLNRIFYYGNPDVLGRKYGLTPELIALVFGDYITGPGETRVSTCIDDAVSSEEYIKGKIIKYIVNCKNAKVISAGNSDSYGEQVAIMTYSDFTRAGDILMPSHTEFRHTVSGSTINITFAKVEIPWDGEIEFIPASRYEKRELR